MEGKRSRLEESGKELRVKVEKGNCVIAQLYRANHLWEEITRYI